MSESVPKPEELAGRWRAYATGCGLVTESSTGDLLHGHIRVVAESDALVESYEMLSEYAEASGFGSEPDGEMKVVGDLLMDAIRTSPDARVLEFRRDAWLYFADPRHSHPTTDLETDAQDFEWRTTPPPA